MKANYIRKQLLSVTAKYNDLIKKQQDLVQKNDELVEKNNALIKKEHDLVQKNDELVEKNNDLIKKQQDLVQKNDDLVEKNNDLVEKNNDLVEKNKDLVEKNESLVKKHDVLVKQLRDKIQCPVCLDVPKKTPIPVCPNGHVVCSNCVREDCPTCRVKMEQGKSSLAVMVMENIDHQCDNDGCQQTFPFGELASHEKFCDYRLVNCPGLECHDKISLASLATHIESCGSVDGNKIEVYRLPCTFNYNTGSDDKGEGITWKLIAMRFGERIFLLKVSRHNVGGNVRWLFTVQVVGGEKIASGFGVVINVHRKEEGPDGKYSQKYSGDVCPIDVTKMTEAEEKGLCLTITDWAMEKIVKHLDNGMRKFSVSVDLFGTDLTLK